MEPKVTNGGGAATLDGELDPFVGTYLKVIRFHRPPGGDAYVPLYLRPGGRFLFLGCWHGFEYASAAGTWAQHDMTITLDGAGLIKIDVQSFERRRSFRRSFHLSDQHHTPILTADAELEEWSLLGWTGPFTFSGQWIIRDPESDWLPESLPKVDAWIDELSKPAVSHGEGLRKKNIGRAEAANIVRRFIEERREQMTKDKRSA